MRDLTAQVTSSLLPFPGVTIDALGEDEITLDSVLHGKFTVGRSGLAWLACGPQLEVVHAVTGERLSAYCFSGGGEHPPSVLASRDFSWLKRSGLLVGLEEAEGSMLCLYDLGLSRVVKAVVIPGRITAIEPLVSYGGASTSTQHLHQSLRWFFGIAAIVTDLGHVLLVDLCLDDLSCSQSELEASDLEVVTKSPAEIPRLREVSSRQGRHLCLQLNGPSGVGATALQYIPRTNQLAVGFSDGYLQLWNMKSLKKEYHSQLEGGRVPVYAFTFQEPENDPRNCCYLWAVQSAQDLEGDVVSLHLLQLAFSERKCLASGKILYEGLEYCEERYSQEVSGAAFPLRAQATNTRLLSCQTIEKFRPHPDRDDSMNEVASPDTSVSIFSWQVKAYGQGTPSTYIGVFDINRWYHAQMPDSLRTGESLRSCPYLAVWSLDPVVEMVSPRPLLDVVVHDRSLSRGLPFTCPPPEQFFNPTTYNFDATCLLNSGIVHLTCSGYQKETLSFLKKAAPCSSDIISTSYSRCLMSGLLSSRLADTQPSSLSQEEQLDAILSTAVETSSLGLITGCIKQWTAEEQPGSALNLRYILEWAWNKVVHTKEELDGICAPLFDSSSNFTDPQTMQLLQQSQRLLGNLSTIFHCLLSEAQELTQKGLVGLINKNMVSSLISQYTQVVLWFCRTGLLPEGSDEDALQISRPFYSHSVISNYYTIRREELTRLAKGKWCADCLMIDGLVGQCGERLVNLWKRDEGGTGQYPPPTLHALLDIYLLESIDEAAKHAIVIYLLLDVMYSFPNKGGASVESFPTAFAIPIGLVKLVQGLWLLDHHDHQSSLELLLHPATSQCQFAWQHERVLQALMCQGQHSVALRYFHITKPPLSSTSQAKLCLSVLLHNRCLVEAWSLLRQHSSRLNMEELLGFLYESCQELGLVKELLKLPLGLTEQESLEKFLQGTGGLQNRELLMVHYLQQANYIPALQLNHSLKMNLVNERDPKLKERFNTRNSILDQYGKVLPRVQRKLAMERAKPYQHPSTIHREVSRPQPLSTIAKRSTSEKVMSRAGFINNVLTKIEEVWLGKGTTPQPSPVKSPRAADIRSPSPKPSSLALPDPFLGTPITMTAKRKSRLLDLVVHPSCQTPRSLLSPPRPPSSWAPPKSISKAPELSLLQTPQVVKRARALAASGPVFSAFTPQSILRSSLRPTPVATPSASPGRSITPPLRSKESRITFIEEAESPEPEKGSIRWSNGMAADSEISLLTRGSPLSKAARQTWTSQPPEEEENVDEEELEEQPHVKFMPPEGGIPSPQPRGSESESSSIHDVPAETRSSGLSLPVSMPARLSLGLETSQASVQSTDTTLEFYDAPLSEELEREEVHPTNEEDDEVVVVNIKAPAEQDEPEQQSLTANEQSPLLTSEDRQSEGQEVEEEKTSEEEMEIGLEQEAKQEEDERVGSEKEDEGDVESSSKQEDGLTLDLGELEESSHNEDHNQDIAEVMASDPEVEFQDQPEEAVEQKDDQSQATETPELTEHLEPSEAIEPTNEPEETMEQTTDLTEFVERHLFGDDLSPPLTRSGIHEASRTWTSFNSEPVCDVQEEEQAAAEGPPVLTSQKSVTSVTSSEPSGTDSHSVVSVNDSEELSSPASEEEEEESDGPEEEEEDEEDEEEEEEEEEDSGSEVEIIEEVQGNGRLPPLQPSPLFVEQRHSHFLPSLSEQEAAELSLITPETELKMVEDEMEGEVVMVRLGADGDMEADDGEDDGTSYTELKPSTTLLVPLELVEGQQGLVDGAQLGLTELGQTSEPEGPSSESQESFSLMLEVEEDGDKEADTLPMENDLQSSTQPLIAEACDELVAQPEVILLSTDDQDTPLSGDASREEQVTEMDTLDGIEVDGWTETEKERIQPVLSDGLCGPEPIKHQTALSDEYMETDQRTEGAEEQEDAEPVMLAEDQCGDIEEPEILSDSGSTPVEELSAALDGKEQSSKDTAAMKDAAVEEMEHEEDKPTPVDDQKEPGTSVCVNDVIFAPEENGPVKTDTPEPTQIDHSTEMAADSVEEQQQHHKALAEIEEENREEVKEQQEEEENREEVQELQEEEETREEVQELQEEEETREEVQELREEENREEVKEQQEENREEVKEQREEKKKRSEDEDGEEEKQVSTDSQPEPQPVLETTTSQRRKKAPSTPTRRTTRGRKTVTFTSSPLEEAEVSEERMVEEMEISQVPASPSRASRRGRPAKETKVSASPPRRSTRKAQPEPAKVEVEDNEMEEAAMDNNTVVPVTSRASTPAKHCISQRASPTRSSRKTRTSAAEAPADPEIVEEEKEEQEDEATNGNNAAPTSSKTPTPAKRRATQGNTPRRASRRILSSNEAAPATLDTLTEEKEQEEAFAPSVKSNSKKTKTVATESQPALLEEDEENKKQQLSSPARVTRQSKRMTLDLYPQVKLVPISLPQSTRKIRGEATTEKVTENQDLPEPTLNIDDPPITNSRRPTRSKLWNHPEEDLPLLDTPLEVDSEIPVADALIKRLQDEEEMQEGVVVTKMVRASKRSTKSSVQPPPVAMRDSLVLEPENDEASPVEHSFIYSPSRRRTRAHKAESPVQSEVSLPRITRTRRNASAATVFAAQDEISSEDNVEVEKAAVVSKTRKTSKRTAKPKAALEPPPILEAGLISPLPSPAEPVPRAQKRIEEGDAPAPRMNLRRKRIMDTVFTKPVTRRKKL
ncbi:protein ELYS isoform X1 [Centroberyx affinis]|uniref:protein ELYS isoform X1 n=1 Tax=Centroberyx affinis TaxID=166261 RepID=UPI003A5BDDCC